MFNFNLTMLLAVCYLPGHVNRQQSSVQRKIRSVVDCDQSPHEEGIDSERLSCTSSCRGCWQIDNQAPCCTWASLVIYVKHCFTKYLITTKTNSPIASVWPAQFMIPYTYRLLVPHPAITINCPSCHSVTNDAVCGLLAPPNHWLR